MGVVWLVCPAISDATREVSPRMLELLTTGFYLPTGEVVLLHPERRVPNGAKLG